MLNTPLTSLRDARRRSAVVIGGSLGAVEALGVILPEVQGDALIPVVVVVHLPPQKPSLLPSLFAARCAVPTREPNDKEPVGGGVIWFAPADYHLLIEHDRCFSLSVDSPVNFSRPSIDVLFESAAEAYGAALVGVVLTGANEDGAAGALAIRRLGGLVVVQDPSNAAASQMPSAAIALADPQAIATVSELGAWLRILTGTPT